MKIRISSTVAITAFALRGCTPDDPVAAVHAARDSDSDGVDDSIDNCPVANPDQRNANYDAELARDRCDTEPVPQDALLVLDTNGSDVRLLRVPVAEGDWTVLGQWTRTLTNTAFAMIAFDDGMSYAVACTDDDGKHTVLRFTEANGAVSLAGWIQSEGALMSPSMQARELGVSLLAKASGGSRVPVGHTIEAFNNGSASDAARCF